MINHMKRLFLLIMTGCLLCTMSVSAQYMSEKEMKKTAAKLAKRDLKEGWREAPGSLPLEQQQYMSFKMKNERNNDGSERYITGSATSQGTVYDAVRVQAMSIAKQNLAALISSEIVAEIENTIGNSQSEYTASIAKTVSGSKERVAQKLRGVVTVIDMYRNVEGTNIKEVSIVLAYDSAMAMKIAKETIVEELEKRGEHLQGELDKLFDSL